MAFDKNKYSYTKIDTYNQCKMKFKLQYVDEHYCFSGSIATEIGTLIHGTEEAIGKAIQAGNPIDYVELKNKIILTLAKLQAKYPKDFAEPDKSERTYSTKVYDYLNSGIYHLEQFMKEHPELEITGLEQKFKYQYDDSHYFTGSIDRVFRDKQTGHIVIQDIKTWPVPEDHTKLATPLQFVVYAMAAAEIYGVDVESISCQYYLPFADCMTQDAGTSGYLKRGKAKLDKLFAGVADENWAPTPSALCHWCNFCPTNENAPEKFKYLCPYFMHWTRESKSFKKENEWQGMENHQAILEYYQKTKGGAL